MFRKAKERDVDRITEIYEEIHTENEAGNITTDWIRGIYPSRETALLAVCRGDMFVEEEEGRIVAAAGSIRSKWRNTQMRIGNMMHRTIRSWCCIHWSSLQKKRDRGTARGLWHIMRHMLWNTDVCICVWIQVCTTRVPGNCIRNSDIKKCPWWRANLMGYLESGWSAWRRSWPKGSYKIN